MAAESGGAEEESGRAPSLGGLTQSIARHRSRLLTRLATGRRRLTPRECATLQGFPADYPIEAAGTKTAMYRGIGNAVVPAVAEAIALAVLR